MIYERRPCNLDIELDRRWATGGNEIAATNRDKILFEIDPEDVAEHSETPISNSEGMEIATRKALSTRTVIHSITGEILAVGNREKIYDALWSTTEAVELELRCSQLIYEADPDAPRLEFMLMPPVDKQSGNHMPVEDHLSAQALETLRSTFDAVKRVLPV